MVLTATAISPSFFTRLSVVGCTLVHTQWSPLSNLRWGWIFCRLGIAWVVVGVGSIVVSSTSACLAALHLGVELIGGLGIVVMAH